MTNPNDNTYPNKSENRQIGTSEFTGGLTKREYFAALAMEGMCSGDQTLGPATESDILFVARRSVSMADALIAELNKEKP